MKITKEQEQELNEFIREGIAHLCASDKNIMNYLAGIHGWFQKMYDNSKEEAFWPTFFLVKCQNTDCRKQLEACIKLLQDIRSDIDSKKQVQASRCANIISICALVVAIILPSILTTQCSNTIKLDDDQLELFNAVVNVDSVSTIESMKN